MNRVRCIAAILLLVALGLDPVAAADRKKCLGADDRRAAIANGKAIPLAKAMRSARVRLRGEVVRARLCEQGQALVYVLTVLGRDGKVNRISVDAAPSSTASGR